MFVKGLKPSLVTPKMKRDEHFAGYVAIRIVSPSD